MAIIKGVGDFFGLDIDSTAVRAVQLERAGTNGWTLKHYGYTPIDQKTLESNSSESRSRLSEAIMTTVGQSGIKTKNVAMSLPSNKSFITVVDMPMVPENELASIIKYQIDDYIPMSGDEAKVDWKLLGRSLHDPSQQEVLIASTANAYVEEQLEFIEGLGFDVIAAEPNSLAMIRSLLPRTVQGVQMIVMIGELSTDIALMHEGIPRLVRTVPTGLATFVRALEQNLSVQSDQARQFILKFGLTQDKLEGQVIRALESTLDVFTSELTKSQKFFETRYPSVQVAGLLLSGYAMVVPELGTYISQKTNLSATNADPWQHVTVPKGDGQFEAVRSGFAVATGLAQRSEK